MAAESQGRFYFTVWKRGGGTLVASLHSVRGEVQKLARGRFHLAREVPAGATHVEVESAELSLMLEGIRPFGRGAAQALAAGAGGREGGNRLSQPGRLFVPGAVVMSNPL